MGSTSISETPAAATEPRVLCYGDSLTAGYISQSPYTQEYAPWAPLLEEILGVPCDAVGASGWTTKQMVEMSAVGGVDCCKVRRPGLKMALQKQKYSVVIIMGGTNDLGMVDADKIIANLRILHEQCHADGCATVALSIPTSKQVGPWSKGKPVAFADERRVEVNNALEKFAREQQPGQCIFIAMDEDVKWSRGSIDYEPDGLHMSAAGYAKFGKLLAPKVRDFVLDRQVKAKCTCILAKD